MANPDLTKGVNGQDYETKKDFRNPEAHRIIERQLKGFTDAYSQYYNHSRLVLQNTKNLKAVLKDMCNEYNNKVSELKNLLEILKEKLEIIANCKAAIKRYETAKDPVVASDGNTYSRMELVNYIEQCRETHITPRSKENQEVLTDYMVSNLSFIKLCREMGQLLDISNVGPIPDFHPRYPISLSNGYYVPTHSPEREWGILAEEESHSYPGNRPTLSHQNRAPYSDRTYGGSDIQDVPF